MAIIACKECARDISDKAACCPHCGVSIAGGMAQPGVAQRKPRRIKPWLYGTLIVGVLAWGALTTLWLMGISPVPRQFASFVGIRADPAPIVKTTKTTVEHPLVRTAQSALELQPTISAIYRTSVEQLDQDYDANEVAIQSKIGGSPVRVSGSVAEINEDSSGHPIVTLHNGSGNGADMLLADDQRSAAAQLSKEEAVEIQCSRMQRIAARLHGSGCVFVLVDANAKPVYLAVSLSNKAGNTPLFIVGPMSRNMCLASSDTIAQQVTSNSGSERILSKSCATTARESLSLEGCHLSSTMSAIPDIPTAHLWKYECTAQAAEARRVTDTATSKRTRARAAAPVAAAAIATSPQPAPASAVAESDSDALAPLFSPKAPQESASGAAANPPDPALIRTAAGLSPLSILESNRETTGGAAPTAANAGNSGSPQPPTPAADTGSTATAATPTTAVADDLTPIRTKDPEAANRIASYCSKLTSSAADPTTVGARCRQDEMAAWTRLTVQNEFPTLDETARRKCSEPPFPDSFVARESCAKYQLHLD
jgi:putative nucleic acid binding protein